MEQVQTASKPKKILIFSLVYYPRFIGGAEIAIKEITDRISPNEIEFDMITLRKQAAAFEKIGNVNVYRVGFPWKGRKSQSSKIFPLSKILFPFFAFLKAVKLYKKNDYDIVWSMMASYAGFAGFLFKKFYPKVTLILSLQEGDNFERREGMFKFLFRKIFSNPDRIQVISHFLKEWAVHMGATCPIEIIPNGVDTRFFSQHLSLEKEKDLKDSIGKKEGDIILITTSRLVVKNAVADIVSALEYLPPSVKFLILGQGYQEKELKEKVTTMKLTDRVRFLGYVPHADMPPYLHISDIFIRPSLTEGFGNSYIEAMAAGIPVIATPVGGIVDFLKDGETGLFCEVQNPRSIAQKVEKLIKDKESRDYILSNAGKMVKEKYEWSLVATSMKNKVFL